MHQDALAQLHALAQPWGEPVVAQPEVVHGEHPGRAPCRRSGLDTEQPDEGRRTPRRTSPGSPLAVARRTARPRPPPASPVSGRPREDSGYAQGLDTHRARDDRRPRAGGQRLPDHQCAALQLPARQHDAPAAPGLPEPAAPDAGTPSGLRLAPSPGVVTDDAHLTPGQCHARPRPREPLPDPACTPGAIDPAVTQADIATTICRTGYTATVRPPAKDTGRWRSAPTSSTAWTPAAGANTTTWCPWSSAAATPPRTCGWSRVDPQPQGQGGEPPARAGCARARSPSPPPSGPSRPTGRRRTERQPADYGRRKSIASMLPNG